MDRLFSVMISSHCKDSLTDLMAMDYNTFFHLEMQIIRISLLEEERAYNKYQMEKANNNR